MATNRIDRAQTWRLAKVTTASTEGAAPYTSTGDLYNGRYLDDSTERTKELSGLAVWTAHATEVDEWLLAVQTPLGHWEGVAFFDWAKPEYVSCGQVNPISDFGTGATAAERYANAVTTIYGRTLVIPDEAVSYGYIASQIDFTTNGYCLIWRSGLRFDCAAYSGRILRRVRVPLVQTISEPAELSNTPNQIGIYTSDTTPATHGTWQTQDGVVDIIGSGRGCVQLKCNVELKDYLFVTMLIDPSWAPTDDVIGKSGAWVGSLISLGLEPVI
jgi:hypothetical protein